MKKHLTVLTTFFLLLFIAFGVSAQERNSPLNNKYVGSYDGRACTLDLTQHTNYGMLALNPQTHKFEAYPNGKDIECLGTFDIYFGGYMSFNILDYKTEGGKSYFIATMQYSDNPNDLMKFGCDISNQGRTLTIYDLDKDPMFGKITLKLTK